VDLEGKAWEPSRSRTQVARHMSKSAQTRSSCDEDGLRSGHGSRYNGSPGATQQSRYEGFYAAHRVSTRDGRRRSRAGSINFDGVNPKGYRDGGTMMGMAVALRLCEKG